MDFINSLQAKVNIASCSQLADEIANVSLRPKFQRYFSADYVNKFLLFYRLTTQDFKLAEIKSVVADNKDDYLFALCKLCNATYFVTGDKLLLKVEMFENTQVVTFAQFKELINRS